MRLQIYPALNIIGGRRYIKKRSSLKTKRCELFPPLNSKITTPVHTPCNQPTQNKWRLATFTLTNQDNYLFWWLNVHKNSNKWVRVKLTIKRAVIDSFTHRFSSRRWPITIQAQRRATNRFMETTEAWSEVDSIWNLDTKEFNSIAIVSTSSKCNQIMIVNLEDLDFL